MARTQTVSISLDEYKELLLRDKPSELDKWLLEGFIEALRDGLTYTDRTQDRWYPEVVGPHMKVDNAVGVVQEMLNILRYRDRELYMSLFNGVMTAERERKANEERVNHMNEAKELRGELSEE